MNEFSTKHAWMMLIAVKIGQGRVNASEIQST